MVLQHLMCVNDCFIFIQTDPFLVEENVKTNFSSISVGDLICNKIIKHF